MVKKSRKKSNTELNTTVDEVEKVNEMYAPEEIEDYKPVKKLQIPQEAVNHYRTLGYDLQWVRIYEAGNYGKLDLQNIQVKENDRYTFVPRKEIPGLDEAMSSYFGEDISDSSHGLYVVGDQALAKFPFARQKAKRAYINSKTKSRSKALIDDLKRNSLAPNRAHGEELTTVEQRPRKDSSEVEFG